jgi:alkylated DNA nucleotide flippase Atl1
MTKPKKSWMEKLHTSHDLPKVVKMTAKQSKQWGEGKLAIPAPIEVDGLMRKVPRGKVTTINEIRSAVAKKHKANVGCPITCGIFACISARAAEEQRAQGKKDITPWWRTLKSDGSLNEKYPGEISLQKKLLTKEGQKMISKGKRIVVDNFQGKLETLKE